jgi:cation diffusion facilitator family transporter
LAKEESVMEKSEKVSILAIGINLALFWIKYTFAGLSGSMALKADAFHSLSDVVASSTVLAGLIIARRKTKTFPYGLYKVENLVSVIISIAIIFAGYEIAMEAMKGHGEDLKNVWLAIVSMICVIGISYGYSRYAKKVGKELNSPSIIADAKHISIDMFAGIVVLTGLLSNFTSFDLDRICAFIIVAIIVWCGLEILTDGIRVLLDASLDYQTLSLAEKLILSEPKVLGIQHLMGRNSGRYKFIEADIILKTHDLDKAHFVARRIEESIRRQIKHVDRVQIYYEPIREENLIYAVPLEDTEDQSISRHFGEAPYFGLITVSIKEKTIIDQKTIENPFTQVDHGKGILVAEFLNKHGIDTVLTREAFEGRGPFYVFANAAVNILLVREETVNLAMENLGVSMNMEQDRSIGPIRKETLNETRQNEVVARQGVLRE